MVAALTFVAVMTTIVITIAIWPGEAKLTAGLLCPDAMPDAFVVSDTYNPAPGETVTNFTMYCMGPRGDVEDVGFGRPFWLLVLAHGLILLGLGGMGRVVSAVRGRRRHVPTARGPIIS